MKINKKLIGIFLILSLLTLFISNHLFQEKVKLLKDEKYLATAVSMQNETKILIDEKKNATRAIAISLSFYDTLKDALKNEKPALIKLNELSLALKNDSDFKNVWFQIITQDGKSFYRSWIDKKGDSLLKARIDIHKILKNPQIMSTVSTGKFDMTFKSMVPIYDDNKFLGIVEVITHFNSIAKKMNKKGIESVILVDKKYKEQLKYPFTKLFIGDYYVANVGAKPQYMKIIEEKNIQHFLDYTDIYHINEKDGNLITLYRLPDINNQAMGYFILFKPLADIDMRDIGTMKEKTFFYVFALILLFATIFYYIANKRFISQISLKNLEMQELNKKLSQSIQEQVEMQKQKEKQQNILFQQSKMASMGEMIGNIAHQWRQPIAIISMWANNIIVDIDIEEIENENLRKYANKINEQTRHLSQTIDDFRNFFSPNKEKTTFTIKESIDKTMNLLTASFKTHNIEVIQKIEDIEIVTLENELTQAMLNIVKNAKDILISLERKDKKLIFINAYVKERAIIIEIIDNGGGVPEDIKDKIFEPYFTTKHKSQGTGIGLYMTESIISKHLNGTIDVENVQYEYEKKSYSGAKFSIVLR
ncbi:MAG: ATP-binding protein [Campylobacterota bacterium]|nr:ATP-binding protein [Campylobacterota bacterium]